MQRLVLFAKDPTPGRVKTRLARDTGEVWAVRLYEAFLEDLSGSVVRDGGWETVIAHGDAEAGPELRRVFARGWTFRAQGPGDLGARLERVFTDSRREGIERTVVVGSDAPTLGAVDVESAFASLAERPGAVFSPSPDGGYALIGLSRDVDPLGLFALVRWSTGDALADTESSARARGITVTRLRPVPDVDTLDDIAPLRERLEADCDLAPATLRVLRDGLPR